MITTAIIVDDHGADRQMAARVLRRQGWTVHTARNSVEGLQVLDQALQTTPASEIVVVTDLNMPRDPAHRLIQSSSAGANLALQLRTQMEQQKLPRLPIIALTSLAEREVHLTAIAFGCDAVLEKPATPNLNERIYSALASLSEDSDMVGASAMLRLLRQRLVEQTPLQPVQFTESDLTRALLQYRRQGLVGLGQSGLAQTLFGSSASDLQRGERLHEALLEHISAITHMDVIDALEVLHGELADALTPGEQAERLAISQSEYYRRRREAIHVLFEVMLNAPANA